MDDDAPAQLVVVPPPPPADRKESAYLLWAYETGQDAKEAALRLGLPVRTVQDWVHRDRWRARLTDERRDSVRRAMVGTELALTRAMSGLADRLHRIAMGQGDTKTVLDKRGQPVTIELPVPYQAQVNALNSLRDWVAPLVADSGSPDPPDPDDAPTPETPAEIHAALRRMLEEKTS